MRKIQIAAIIIVMMCGMIVPSVMSSAASCGEIVSQDTEAVLKAVDYEKDEKVAALLAPSRYSMTDITNKKLEIVKWDGRNILDISDDEAKKELNKENVQVMSLGSRLKKCREKSGRSFRRLLIILPVHRTRGQSFLPIK